MLILSYLQIPRVILHNCTFQFNENERKLDLGKARLEENIYNRASGAKNIEEGVQQSRCSIIYCIILWF